MLSLEGSSLFTVAVNKKLMFRFRFTIVLSKKTNRKRSHNYTLYITVWYSARYTVHCVAKVTTV